MAQLTERSSDLHAEAAQIAAAFRDMLGPSFTVACAPPDLAAPLHGDERAYVRQAVGRRQAEFASARHCARRALADLGVIAGSLVPHADRSPRWPPGIRGSITHSPNCCVVAVTDDCAVIGAGIDLEAAAPLDSGLIPRICTPGERARLETTEGLSPGVAAKAVFSAKEAVYKCQYPSTRARLDFLDIELELDARGGQFQVVTLASPGPTGWRRIRGRLLHQNGLILASAVLQA